MANSQRGSNLTNGEMAAAIGVMAAGAALIEAALIPGIVIGAAAVLAPKYGSKLRQRLKPLFRSTGRTWSKPAAPLAVQPDVKLTGFAPARLGIKQAVLKTITFRVVVITVDFTTNYVVLGELVTAASLSGITLVAGPIFYFAHETAWNYFGPSAARHLRDWGITVGHPVLPPPEPATDREGFKISRALAKTVTFRFFATIMDFATNYVMTRNLANAVTLSTIGFVVGPFVYIGHEKIWDHYDSPGKPAARIEDLRPSHERNAA